MFREVYQEIRCVGSTPHWAGSILSALAGSILSTPRVAALRRYTLKDRENSPDCILYRGRLGYFTDMEYPREMRGLMYSMLKGSRGKNKNNVTRYNKVKRNSRERNWNEFGF